MSKVVVLGGGISGLSAAYYLSRLAPSTTKIILIESQNRLGGWVHSRRVGPGYYDSKTRLPSATTQNKESLLFESGPRSLRPSGVNGAIMLEMIQHLKLNNDNLITVSKDDPSSKNRYIYYDGKINTLPTGLGSLLFNKPPICKSLLSSLLFEPFRSSRFDKNGIPKDGKEDESIYSLVARRFNDHVAINLLGAVVHGIYGGDVKQLSAKSTFRSLYEAERSSGSILKGLLRKSTDTSNMRERGISVRARAHDPDWFAKMEKMSIFGFKDGLGTIPHHLHEYLKSRPNVEIIIGDGAESIQKTKTDKEIHIKTVSGKDIFADHIVSSIPSFALENLVKQEPLPHLDHNPATDVAVVNFAYAPDVELGYDGFGMLTPYRETKTHIPVPGTQGIIFDSNSIPGQESDHLSDYTKVTAVLGGTDWSDAFGKVSVDELDPRVAYDYARKAMSSYLHIDAKPTHSMVGLQKKCIPQYIVGHESRMRGLAEAIKSKYGHLMSLTGASYIGVSVPDCIKSSRMLVEELLVSGALGSREKIVTGLGKMTEGNTLQDMKDSANLNKGSIDVLMKA